MGQYLCIGIYTQIRASRKAAESQYHNIDECHENIVRDKGLDENLYEFHKGDEDIYYTLKSDILERDIVALTKRFYEMRYEVGNKYDSEAALQALEKCKNSQEVMALVQSKGFQCFQEGFTYDYVTATRSIGGMLIDVRSIIQSMDGKIIMECYGGLFRFFTRLIQEKLADIPLSKALHVYIDG